MARLPSASRGGFQAAPLPLIPHCFHQTMIMRRYRQADLPQIARLFYDTVHIVNAKEYGPEQLDAWATGNIDMAQWDATLNGHLTYVAVEGERILGFGDITTQGYLDHLYVHHEYQRNGIATLLCQQLEHECGADTIYVHASITAVPFFLKRGYRIIQEQQVTRHGVILTNYRMAKVCVTSHHSTLSTPE